MRVFIVEDSPVIRERLTESVMCPGRIKVVGYAQNEAEAVAALAGRIVIVLTNYAYPQDRARSRSGERRAPQAALASTAASRRASIA